MILGFGTCVRFSIVVHVPFHWYWKATVRLRLLLAGTFSVTPLPLAVTVPEAMAELPA